MNLRTQLITKESCILRNYQYQTYSHIGEMKKKKSIIQPHISNQRKIATIVTSRCEPDPSRLGNQHCQRGTSQTYTLLCPQQLSITTICNQTFA